MKFLIVLAALLLVPIVAKFQTKTILETSNPKSIQLVEAVLRKHGVSQPEVTMNYLDVSIGGLIETEKSAGTIAREVEAIRGLRLAKNQLIVQGWLTITREEGEFTARGLIPSEWESELFKGQPELTHKGVQTQQTVRLPGKSAVSWGIFIDQFFRLEGRRSLAFKGAELILTGETIPSEVANYGLRNEPLGAEIKVKNQLTLRPSRFHLKSRVLQSDIEGEPLRSLRRKLSDSLVSFEPQSIQATPHGIELLNELASLMIQTEAKVQFILGCHPHSGNSDLARRRARSAKSILENLEVSAERLQLETFELTKGETKMTGKVELLVR